MYIYIYILFFVHRDEFTIDDDDESYDYTELSHVQCDETDDSNSELDSDTEEFIDLSIADDQDDLSMANLYVYSIQPTFIPPPSSLTAIRYVLYI